MPSFDAINIDDIIAKTLALCEPLPRRYQPLRASIEECASRLSQGALRLAVMGMFKRGKSSFINTLLGIEILPTSVIPVTSIPTTISYGKTLRCVVKFSDAKPDYIVEQTPEKISACLTQYVAEENNPNNTLAVAQTLVECPNRLLENGTILIDTPGFGSTHLHNTKTTMDLLTQCDAVLFLLSADPPCTQTELEFLMEVRKAVPRIFFILNKIDLLTVDELHKIDGFLKNVLSKKAGFAPDVHVFHVSAKIGQTLKNIPENNPTWQVSGMAAVRTGIIDFMVREKYFTLSQAISEKLKTTLADIQEKLQADHRDLTAPVEEAKKELEWLIRHGGSIQKKIDKERGLIEVEIKAFGEFVDKTIDAEKAELLRKATDALRTVLAGVLLRKANLAGTVHAAFEQHATALFDRLFLQVVNSVNKPLKKAIVLHINEFIRLLEEIKKSAPSTSIPLAELTQLEETLEIRVDDAWRLEGVATAFQQIKLPFCGFFASNSVKRQRYQECFSMAITEIINRNILLLSMHTKELISVLCREFKRDLDSRFEEITNTMSKVMEDKQKVLDGFEATVKTQAQALLSCKSAFEAVEKMLP